MADPYDVLGVGPGARWAEVRKAYLRRVRALHPDVNADERAVDAFHAVQEAYAALRAARCGAGRVGTVLVPGVDLAQLRVAVAAAVAALIAGREPVVVICGRRMTVRIVRS